MVTKVQKWGNSLGLRIPKSFADEAGIEAGSAVDITLVDGRLVVRPLDPARYEIDDLVSRVTEDNIHYEIDTGDPEGRENW